jgi:hypothetical protein
MSGTASDFHLEPKPHSSDDLKAAACLSGNLERKQHVLACGRVKDGKSIRSGGIVDDGGAKIETRDDAFGRIVLQYAAHVGHQGCQAPNLDIEDGRAESRIRANGDKIKLSLAKAQDARSNLGEDSPLGEPLPRLDAKQSFGDTARHGVGKTDICREKRSPRSQGRHAY